MRRSRHYSRRPPQRTTWYSQWYTKTVSLTSNGSPVTFLLGTHTFSDFPQEVTLERTRGSVFGVTGNSAWVAQMIVCGLVLDKKLAETLTDLNVPNPLVEADGDDYFVYESFACVDSNAANAWNGRAIDSKAKRRFEHGKALAWVGVARAIKTLGTSQDLDIGLNTRVLFRFA